MFKSSVRKSAAATALVALALATGACANNTDAASTDAHESHAEHESHAHNEAHMHTHHTWVKSAAAGEMTAVFGELHNEGETPLELTGVTSDSAGSVQVHEVVNGMMQETATNLVIGPDETVAFEPGGYHFMLMDLKRDILAGDSVALTLTFSDGSTFELTAEARDYAGAEEGYAEHEAEHDHDHDH
ncbi:copper chaperone PCu(A)C [Canibacter zhoujuaniae]|nr:copper chaperone PCu(A)C [Canibacter zhoujuaniae]